MSQREVDTQNAEPESQPTGSGLNWDRMTALLAIVLSVTAILVSLFEVNSVRAHSKASVWPHLSVTADDNADQISVQVSNKGVGPALIRDALLYLDGEIVSDLEVAIADRLNQSELNSPIRYDVMDLQNRVIAAGETVSYFTIDLDPALNRVVSTWSEQADVELCYCSIQEDCWRTSLVSADTAQVSSCATSNHTLSGPHQIVLSGNEFDAIVGQVWEGTLSYRDYTSDDQVEIPVKAEIQSVTNRTIVYRLIYPNETQYNSIQRIRISTDGARIDEQPIISRKRQDDGRLQIITQGRSTDNNEAAAIRIVYEIGSDAFDISQQVRPDGTEDYFERNRYSFRR